MPCRPRSPERGAVQSSMSTAIALIARHRGLIEVAQMRNECVDVCIAGECHTLRGKSRHPLPSVADMLCTVPEQKASGLMHKYYRKLKAESGSMQNRCAIN